MNASLSGCSCGCSPCGCGAAPPCQDFNPPRPCFFPGQLVTADDLNAVMTYVQSRERLIMQLTGGWGILGGFQVQGVGTKSRSLFEDSSAHYIEGITVNPLLVAGSAVQVTGGTAIDASGRLLNRSVAQPLNLQKASQGLGAPQRAATCVEWFGAQFCSEVPGLDPFTAAEFWLVAEYTETPSRPMPALAGGGACETGALCDFTRKQPGVKLSLVKDLPLAFYIHGCLDAPEIPYLDSLIALSGGGGGGGEGSLSPPPLEGASLSSVSASNQNTGANDAVRTVFSCTSYRTIPQLYEFLANVGWGYCCNRPAIALARILLVSQSEQFAGWVGESPYYVVIDQGFPYRRQTPSTAALHQQRVLSEAADDCPPLVGEG